MEEQLDLAREEVKNAEAANDVAAIQSKKELTRL